MEKITISKEILEAIIEMAFIDGENWGITHHNWFTPSSGDTRLKIESSIRNAYLKIKQSNK